MKNNGLPNFSESDIRKKEQTVALYKNGFSRNFHSFGRMVAVAIERNLLKMPDNFRIHLSRLRSFIARIPPGQWFWLKRQISPFSNKTSKYIKNWREIVAPQRVVLSTPSDRDFFKVSKYYTEGYFNRPPVGTYELFPAYVLVGLGVVTTDDFKLVVEPGMRHCLDSMPTETFVRPLEVISIPGTVTNIYTLWSSNIWHFIYDCLAKIHSLNVSYPGELMTLVMPDSLSESQKELLSVVAPKNFELRFFPEMTWLKVERLIIPTFVTMIANGLLPTPYYHFLRNAAFSGFGIVPNSEPHDRIYLSRAGAKFRRILNEDAVFGCLEQYGFHKILPEHLSMRDQVELFNNASVVVSPHGAGLGTTLFSGAIKVLILYPNPVLTTYFITQMKGLGQEHFFLAGTKPTEWDDFEVDLDELNSTIVQQLGLTPSV